MLFVGFLLVALVSTKKGKERGNQREVVQKGEEAWFSHEVVGDRLKPL